MKYFLVFACSVAFACGGISAEQSDFYRTPRKKLIECSWTDREMSTAFLRENIAEIEKAMPYSGMRIVLHGTGDGKGEDYKTIFGKTPWKREWFEEDIRNLKATKFKAFTDNFLGAGVTPGNVDYFSDSDWKTVCGNFALLAQIAKETGMKGIIFDPEEYHAHLWQRINITGHTREEIFNKARQRGREFGTAIFTAFPEIRLFCFFMFGMCAGSSAEESASLYLPFLNGIYDVMPPEAMLIDGEETSGYCARDAADFAMLHARKRMSHIRMIDRKHLAKFFMQTQVASAIYTEPYFRRTKNLTTWREMLLPAISKFGELEAFHRNLIAAMDASDEYTWTYSEYLTWHPVKPETRREYSLEACVPGITEAVRGALQPLEWAEKNAGENLVRNGSFANADKNGAPVGWGHYEGGRSSAALYTRKKLDEDGWALSVRNAANSFVTQSLLVDETSRYFVIAKAKFTADANAPYASGRIVCTWRFRDGSANWQINRDSDVFFGAPDSSGWRTARLLLTPPEGFSRLFLQLNVKNLNGNEILFTDVAVRKISKLSPETIQVKRLLKTREVTGPNLLKNTSFGTGVPLPKTTAPWSFWKPNGSKGSISMTGKGIAVGADADGLLYQGVKCVPGREYVLRCSAESPSEVILEARWMDENQRWLPGVPGEHMRISGGQPAELRVKVPEKAGYLAFAVGIPGNSPVTITKAEIHELK